MNTAPSTIANGTNITTAVGHIDSSPDNEPSAPAVATRVPESEIAAAPHAGQVGAAPRP